MPSTRKRETKFRAITIVGVGLIGGSLGLAIRQTFARVRVTGVDKRGVLRRARRRGAIDVGTTNLRKAASEADLILLATPLWSILRLLPRVGRFAPRTAIVSDVGSVKLPVMRLAEKYFPHGNFIGGHPMAGAELSGVSAAHPLLFKKAVYLLTPTSKTRGSVISSFSRFVTQLGARPTKLEAETHDHAVAAVSHLAQLTAVALTNVVGRRHPVARRYLSLAAGGFRDMTRIASSDPTIWRDILELNAGKIHLSLRHLQKELKRYESLLRTAGALDRDFKRAKKIRAGI